MKEIDYVVENAAFFVHKHASKKVSKKFSIKDIIEVLNAKDDWADQSGEVPELKKLKEHKIPVVATINYDKLMAFVIDQCSQKGIVINHMELAKIMNTEGMYYDAILGTSFEEDLLKYSAPQA